MDILENKYIELILKKCLNFSKNKSLLINIEHNEHLDFALKVKQRANEMGIDDVCIDLRDMNELHNYLKNTSEENIKLNPLISREKWDTYAKKGGGLLFLESAVPGLMDDIPENKIAKWLLVRRESELYYRKYVSSYIFSWTVAALPNQVWAEKVYPNSTNANNELYLDIFKMCMVDKKDPIKEWDIYIQENNRYKDILNSLEITELHYSNSIGTDLHVSKNASTIWMNLDKRKVAGMDMIVNLPSYEIFTTPDYRKTNGIVYSSKPLIYNGTIIDEFYLKFKNGEVIDFDAKIGKRNLENIIKVKNARYLGEAALVSFDSPISNLNKVYMETLFDENASCHLALGSGSPKCFPIYDGSNIEQINSMGRNDSPIHVDFMIGTSDLNIEAVTNKGKVKIFSNGNFII